MKDGHIRERCLELHGAHPDSCFITLPARLDEVVGVKRPLIFTIILKLVRTDASLAKRAGVNLTWLSDCAGKLTRLPNRLA